MSRPLRIQFPGAYYHVTCRGNDRKNIFLDQEDRKAFLEKLSLSLSIYQVSLLAYVLMSNHFHLLIVTPQGNLSEFMRHFNISYTSAFNRRHRRAGHLYQGRYKAFLIDKDNYLLEVSRYIHLNPIRVSSFSRKEAGEKWKELLQYPDSSFLEYFKVGKRRDDVDYKTILNYNGGDNKKGRGEYRKFVQAGILKETKNPLLLGKGTGIIGERDFIKWVKKKFSGDEDTKREQPAVRELNKNYDPKDLIEEFCWIVKKNTKELCQRGKKTVERAMLMELLYRYSKLRQPEIGKLIGGIDYSSVSQARSRLQIRMTKEPKIRKRFETICDQLSRRKGVLPKAL
jgi:REP element-mobilizing transposase RayT